MTPTETALLALLVVALACWFAAWRDAIDAHEHWRRATETRRRVTKPRKPRPIDTAERRPWHTVDQELRDFGFEIVRRPKRGQAVWRLRHNRDVVMGHDEAVEYVREVKAGMGVTT